MAELLSVWARPGLVTCPRGQPLVDARNGPSDGSPRKTPLNLSVRRRPCVGDPRCASPAGNGSRPCPRAEGQVRPDYRPDQRQAWQGPWGGALQGYFADGCGARSCRGSAGSFRATPAAETASGFPRAPRLAAKKAKTSPKITIKVAQNRGREPLVRARGFIPASLPTGFQSGRDRYLLLALLFVDSSRRCSSCPRF